MSDAIPRIVEATAGTSLIAFDCSFCDVSPRKVFEMLANDPNCALRSLRMQGIRINKSVSSVVEIIEKNKQLENLVLDHPREPFNIDPIDVRTMMRAMRWNYHLQTFKFDVARHSRDILHEADFWMNLNRCGRGLL